MGREEETGNVRRVITRFSQLFSVRNWPSEVMRYRESLGYGGPPATAALYFDVVTSKTTVAAFLPLAGFPLARFGFANLMTILPPTAVNARTS